MYFKIDDVGGLRLFYREAGDPVEADRRPPARFSLVVHSQAVGVPSLH